MRALRGPFFVEQNLILLFKIDVLREDFLMKTFTREDLSYLDQRFNAAFINCLSGFKSLNLIGTISGEKKTNLAIFNSVFHLGASPPLMGFISRPSSVARHTLENIEETGFYTINHVTGDFYQNAHQTSARYPGEISEFTACRLTEEFKGDFLAPYVKESPIQIGLKFVRSQLIPENGVQLLIGEIMEVHFPGNCLRADGFLDIEMAGTICGNGLDSYHTTSRIARLTYAKPDKWPEQIHGNS